MNSIGIVGAGAWGTALALFAHRAGHPVQLWARDPERRLEIAAQRENRRLPGVTLPKDIELADDPSMPGSALLLLAVPMQHFRAIAGTVLPAGRPLVAVAKGMEAGTGLLPLEILAELHPDTPAAVLAGPNFAAEIAAGLPAATVLAAADGALRQMLLGALAGPGLRLYGNADPLGVQVGGAAKNVIAIAAGAVIGAGWGENARAALVTRGLAELSRLVEALGGRRETSFGLSGLGDLVLTCTGRTSRNFRYGLALGRGEVPCLEGVAEGVATAPALVARAASSGCEVPVAAAVARLLKGEMTLRAAMAELLARPQRDE
ncbi:MAG TPA: NAD(P)H-dependent glycerol-3-phosphate dehydrogenase [Acetobacteraceae bacterium]|jgi:glycerol-3-phosphate dehydrogenase (NAD(P)+)|nr:NAD(P)H-dependent glycerol-3-phosphate dehydrogenase [Acetobacteraceae bacterium]